MSCAAYSAPSTCASSASVSPNWPVLVQALRPAGHLVEQLGIGGEPRQAVHHVLLLIEQGAVDFAALGDARLHRGGGGGGEILRRGRGVLKLGDDRLGRGGGRGGNGGLGDIKRHRELRRGTDGGFQAVALCGCGAASATQTGAWNGRRRALASMLQGPHLPPHPSADPSASHPWPHPAIFNASPPGYRPASATAWGGR